MASITFLGTGGDSIVIGKQLRASGGIVLNLEDNQFLLNPGPGCLVRARQAGISLRDTIAVLVSNHHTHHANDINAVLDAMSVSGLDRIGVLVAGKEVIHGDEKEGPILMKKSHEYVERVLELSAGMRVGINNINIYATKTSHTGLGFIFETATYRIGYASDTDFTDEIADQYKECSVLILNCRHPKKSDEPGHLSTESAIQFMQKARPRMVILSGLGIKMLQADPLFEAREMQRHTSIETTAATDGLIINPTTLSADSRQFSLDRFN